MKIIFLLLAILLNVILIPAYADEPEKVDNYEEEIAEDENEIQPQEKIKQDKKSEIDKN